MPTGGFATDYKGPTMNRAMVLVISAIAAWAQGATVLLQDDFKSYARGSDGSPMWAADSGEWKVTDEGFLGTDCEGHFTAMGTRSGRKEWADYTLSLKLKIVSRGGDWRDGPWIGVRYLDAEDAYTIGFYDRLTALHKASRGKATVDEAPLGQSATTIQDNAWHDVAITVVGAKIAVALDGKTILSATDDGKVAPAVPSGGIVLAARKYEKSEGKTQVLFKDVRVEAVGAAAGAVPWTLKDAQQAAEGRWKQVSVLEFLKSRRGRRYERVPRKVLAFYYTWYGRPERGGQWRHWAEVDPEKHTIGSSTHYPAKGAYDSHDPEIIDYHIGLAKSHGVDGFIATWWGQDDFHDRAFAKLLDHAANKGFEATIYWETAPGKGRAKIARAINDLVYILEKYGSHPAFLKLDGKPVIFVYGRVMEEVELSEWPEIISAARERYGKDFLLVADGYREDYARLFDGVHTYNPCGWVAGKKPDELAALSRKTFADDVALARSQGKVSCLTVIPGYDDTKIRKPGLDAKRQDGETYRVLWEQAIAADPDWVLITSWNEWHEGSEIEPSWEDGDKYIQMTAKYAKQFKRTPYGRARLPATLAAPSPERAKAIRALYEGKTIGILPDFGGKAVFWLADAGVELRELAWRDVLDPALFNPKSLPVVVYAGYESYVQTVKEQGDVDRAILRYLGEGGLLMVLPTGPFPFYYNEQKKAVASAARFGLPIQGGGPPGTEGKGWEKPPAEARLTFRTTNNLLGLMASVPFPAAGDLRWRPCVPAGLVEGDVYTPLVKLVDEQGRDYGDGIVYIEHMASPPRKGKLIYAWMRMADILGPDEVFFGLFRLAAK